MEFNTLKHEGSILENGYGIIPKKIMLDKRLSIEAKAIYSYFSSFCGGGKTQAYPSETKIIDDLQITTKRYYKYLKELKEYGYIKVEKKRIGKKWDSNIYVLNQFILQSDILTDAQKKPIKNAQKDAQKEKAQQKNQGANQLNDCNINDFEPSHFEHSQFEHGQNGHVQNDHTNNNSSFNNNNSLNNIKDITHQDNAHTQKADLKKSKEEQFENEFDLLWKMYPRKKDKKRAFTSYKGLRKKYSFDVIEKSILAYIKYIKDNKTEEQYIKHGSTFFNSGIYDYIDSINGGVSHGTSSEKQCDVSSFNAEIQSKPKKPSIEEQRKLDDEKRRLLSNL